MRVRTLGCGFVLGVLAALGAGALGQVPEDLGPAATVGAELRGLASRAGVVFVGQVEKIEPKDGVVETTFTVEQSVLGVVGGSYVMREWAGRWTGGQQHFRLGQRAMFFLYAPNAAGLSSAVDGMIGVVPVVPMGANGQSLLDVRWVSTRVRRGLRDRLAGAAGTSEGGMALADGAAVVRDWKEDRMAEPKGVRLPEGVVGQGAGLLSTKEVGDGQR